MQSTKQDKYFALVDCNNFYVSCERVFNPSLKNKPVAILSNNDGCIVARSQEIKDLGIPMGAPYFKYKQQLQKSGAEVFSSNYSLYAEMSRRVMETISKNMPELEIYSIDEAFVLMSGSKKQIEEEAKNLRYTILRWTGIPVSIGIAKTKTLAKVANYYAKKKKSSNGIFVLSNELESQAALCELPVGEIWGIGRKISNVLQARGIQTADEFLKCNLDWIRKEFKIFGVRTYYELTGKSCYELDEMPESKKSIISSRSFGRPVTELRELEEAVSSYTARAAEKMRKQELTTEHLYLFICTNRFSKEKPQYYNSISIKLPSQTEYTPTLISFALEGLKKIYKEGYEYKKAGVMFNFLSPNEERQENLCLFEENKNTEKETKLMKLVDSMNNRYGKKALRFAAEGIKKSWSMHSDFKSKNYTGRWSDLPNVH